MKELINRIERKNAERKRARELKFQLKEFLYNTLCREMSMPQMSVEFLRFSVCKCASHLLIPEQTNANKFFFLLLSETH